MKRLSIIFLFFIRLWIIHSQSCDSLSRMAEDQYNLKNYSKTIDIYIQMGSNCQLNNEDYLTMGKAYSENKEYTKALEIFNTLLLKDSSERSTIYWIGVTNCYLDRLDYYPSAISYFALYIKKAEPDTVNQSNYLWNAYHYMCSYYLYKPQPNKDSTIYYAQKLLDYSQNKQERLAIAYASFTAIYLKTGNYKLAENYAGLRTELVPENENFKTLYNEIKKYRRATSISYWNLRMKQDSSYLSVRKGIEDSLSIYYTKEDIPKTLMDTLKIWIPNISFANPNEKWEPSDVISDPNLPTRRIVFILKSKENIYIIFEHGGIGKSFEFIWAKLNGDLVDNIWAAITLKEITCAKEFKNLILHTALEPIHIYFL